MHKNLMETVSKPPSVKNFEESTKNNESLWGKTAVINSTFKKGAFPGIDILESQDITA